MSNVDQDLENLDDSPGPARGQESIQQVVCPAKKVNNPTKLVLDLLVQAKPMQVHGAPRDP